MSEQPDSSLVTRYRVQFTPVGWHVIDSIVARDPVAQFGTGNAEYQRAKAAASELNATENTEATGDA